jgi:hypothetical protein
MFDLHKEFSTFDLNNDDDLDKYNRIKVRVNGNLQLIAHLIGSKLLNKSIATKIISDMVDCK